MHALNISRFGFACRSHFQVIDVSKMRRAPEVLKHGSKPTASQFGRYLPAPVAPRGSTMSAVAGPSHGHASVAPDNRPLLPAVSLVLPEEEMSQDVGNIIHLEHLNLEVLDLEVARTFYGEGLGLALDPGTLASQRGAMNVHWYNIGRQQFHIVRRKDKAQVLPAGGVVGIVLPDLDSVYKRLEHVQAQLPSIKFRRAGTGGPIEVTDPFGVVFRVHQSFGRFPFPRGIAYISLPCYAGTAHSIADFYRGTLGAVVHTSLPAHGAGTAGAHSDEPVLVVEVVVGPGSSLVFHESAALGERDDKAVMALDSGWHVALYLTNFSGAYKKLETAGLIHNNHPYRDKCNSLADALGNRQYRFQDIPFPDGKGLAYRLNHEVRSTHHLRFLRPLYNWHGENFDAL